MFKNVFRSKRNYDPKVEIWTNVEGLTEISECVPRPAAQVLPHWLKSMSAEKTHNRSAKNIKHCPVIPDFMAQGYIIPMWCDTILRVGDSDKDWSWNTSSDKFLWEIHTDNQMINHIPDHHRDHLVFKAISPWYIKTPEGYSVYQMPLLYHFIKDFNILSGSIRTDVYHEINQQVLVKHNSEIFIPRGTPFAWYIPYERKKYELVVSQEDESKKKMRESSIQKIITKFSGGYNALARESDRKKG
jgi:hypothetical protein